MEFPDEQDFANAFGSEVRYDLEWNEYRLTLDAGLLMGERFELRFGPTSDRVFLEWAQGERVLVRCDRLGVTRLLIWDEQGRTGLHVESSDSDSDHQSVLRVQVFPDVLIEELVS
jgi:hypothetical protein